MDSISVKNDWNVSAPIVEISGLSGKLLSAFTDVHMTTTTHAIHKWRLTVPVGDKLQMYWILQADDPVSLFVCSLIIIYNNLHQRVLCRK